MSNRHFLPDDLRISSWESIAQFYDDLKNREIGNKAEYLAWVEDLSELEAVVSEDAGWRYIKMTVDTNDKEALARYTAFVQEIQPKIAPYDDIFNKKLINSPFADALNSSGDDIYKKRIQSSIQLFREANIELQAKIAEESQQFGAISGAQSIEVDGEDITMQQASVYLKSLDRQVREDVYRKMTERRLEDRDKLDELFNSLVSLRNQVAKNADQDNYRDYKFIELSRLDYTAEDCLRFHDSIEVAVVPILTKLQTHRKETLGLDTLRPWDGEVDLQGKEALKPFDSGEAMINGTIKLFTKIRPQYGEYLKTMKSMGHLDLESKKGKAPGGYNYPLYESGVPFIFMNSVGSHRDLVTMVHEGGHAIHSFLSRDLKLTAYKHLPSEVAELASMSMELISMEHWDMIFEDAEELKRAKREHIEKLFMILPWVATIDAFQHWIYTHPNHSVDERTNAWLEISDRFSSGVTDYSGFEEAKATAWQKQLHLYEVPFYYVEYAMAQLGAIAVWRNYKQNPEKALDDYEKALQLGYTKSIPEIYETAGISFDFSKEYVSELMDFVSSQLDALD